MFIQNGILGTLLYLLYVQFSPTMGNVWYRCGYFSFKGAWNLIVHPFYEKMMWRPVMWPINYPIWLFSSFALTQLYYITICTSNFSKCNILHET